MKNDYLKHAHGKELELKAMKGFVEHVDQFSRLADSFKHLGDVNRVRIFWMLTHAQLCTACIASMMDMSSPAVAHHLKLLREAGLIEGVREGKEVRYHAVNTPQARALHDAIEGMLAISCPVTSKFSN